MPVEPRQPVQPVQPIAGPAALEVSGAAPHAHPPPGPITPPGRPRPQCHPLLGFASRGNTQLQAGAEQVSQARSELEPKDFLRQVLDSQGPVGW